MLEDGYLKQLVEEQEKQKRAERNFIPKELLCFTTKNFISTGLPVKKPKENEFKRHNNLVTTNLMAPQEIGLPYGKIPRLAIIKIVTYIYQKKSQIMYIGTDNREHFENLGLNPNTSGRHAAEKNSQLNRLLNCAFYIEKKDGNGLIETERFFIAKRNSTIDIKGLIEIEFSDEFYHYVLDKKNIVPLNKSNLEGLSAVQLDLYIMLSYWLRYLSNKKQRKAVITYEKLKEQLGLSFEEKRHLLRCIKMNMSGIESFLLEGKVNFGKSGLEIELYE